MTEFSERAAAIVGIGCRFPGRVSTPEEFWEFLRQRGDGVVDPPGDRWNWRLFHHPDPAHPGRMPVVRAGFVTHWDPTTFDAGFFGIAPRDAAPLDPQQRLALEVAWEALEDAGLPKEAIAGRRVGVFMGAFTQDRFATQMSKENRRLLMAGTATASGSTMISARIAHFLDLRGPCLSVDTACSSSLVAFDLAVKSIETGESSMALTGGVNVMMRPETTMTMAASGFLAADGRSKSFDDRADGYGRGEGAGVVLLKTLKEALADGDRIYAVVCGTGVNQDGRTPGIATPNEEAQRLLIEEVLGRVGLDPASIGYVEAHGTGTAVGDPLECRSISAAVAMRRRDQAGPCSVGSVKANIGHLEAAAGIAGVIKAALTLHKREIAPQAFLDVVNSDIPLDALNLTIPTAPTPLARSGSLFAAVNSFGYGGTNAHVVLGAVPAHETSSGASPSAGRLDLARTDGAAGPLFLALSGATPSALRALCESLRETIAGSPPNEIGDLCWTAATRRTHHAERAAFVGDSAAELSASLGRFLSGAASGDWRSGRVAATGQGPVFVFSGMGPQWWAMARGLLEQSTQFRDVAEDCDRVFTELSGWRLIDALLVDEDRSRIADTRVAQPGTTLIQIALTEHLKARGVRPAAVLGHSVGEVGAAYAAGALTLDQSMTVAFHRSQSQATLAGCGGMLAVELSVEEAARLIATYGDAVAIGAVNGPRSVTLSGEHDALERISAHLTENGVFAKALRVEIPYHSGQMDRIRDRLAAALTGLRASQPTTPIYSTVTGDRADELDFDAAYWWRNVRQPVRFADAARAAMRDGHRNFVEIGPHPVLTGALRACAAERAESISVSSTLSRKADDWSSLANLYCSLYTSGAHIDFEEALGAGRHAELPRYPFQRSRHWSEPEALRIDRLGAGPRLAPGAPVEGPTTAWRVEIDDARLPWLVDHVVDGATVFPAAGFLDVVAEVVTRGGERDPFALYDIAIERALLIPRGDAVELWTSLASDRSITIMSRVGSDEPHAPWHVNVRMKQSAMPIEPPEAVDLSALDAEFAAAGDVPDVYRRLDDLGLRYGPSFRALQSVRRLDARVLARISLPEAIDLDGSKMFAGLVDASFQSLIAALPDEETRSRLFVPVSMRELRVYAPIPRQFTSLGAVVSVDDRNVECDLALIADDGSVLAEILGLGLRGVERAMGPSSDDVAYRVSWREAPTTDPSPAEKTWLVLPGATEIAPRLVDALRRAGGDATVVAPDDLDALEHALAAGDVQGLIDCRFDLAVDASSVAAGRSAERAATSALQSLQLFAQHARVGASLVVATRAAQAISNDEILAAPDQAAAIGAARVAASELAHLRVIAIDLPEEPASIDFEAFVASLAPSEPEVELVIRRGVAYAPRIERREESPEAPPRRRKIGEGPVELQLVEAGHIENLRWAEAPDIPPEDDQVEVAVQAVSLNFKDVLKTLGMLDQSSLESTYFGDGLGMEFAGTVRRIGPNARRFRVGDEIVVPFPDSLRSRVMFCERDLINRPQIERLTPAENASLSVVFVTAYYGLVTLGGLKSGDHVLIHAGAGGVGQAAIEVAKWRGAVIHATAGTPDKRAWLRQQGCQFVYSSRDAGFVEAVRSDTGGRGVNVVLNSIAGELAERSLAALAPWGVFVEIGKRDFAKNAKLDLGRFSACLRYAALDVDRMLHEHPQHFNQTLSVIWEAMRAGDLQAPPVRGFRAGDVRAAFRHLSQARNIGKVAIEFDDAEEIDVHPSETPRALFDRNARYLVTGGLGGFGAETARWLAEHGAGTLTLVSRSGPRDPRAGQIRADLERLGAAVDIRACDVSNPAEVDALFASFEDGAPLRGVFHAAGVLEDALIAAQSADAVRRVLAPKATGAFNLHRASLAHRVEHFVLYSSISALIGNVGQVGYAAANAALDALALHRRALGLPALSVNWGAIADVGMAAESENASAQLERVGVRGLSAQAALSALEGALRAGDAQSAIIDVDWNRWASVVGGAMARKVETLRSAAPADQGASLAADLETIQATDRVDVVAMMISEIMGDILQLTPETIDGATPLVDLGVDSLAAVELQTGLALAGFELSTVGLMSAPGVTALARDQLTRLGVSFS